MQYMSAHEAAEKWQISQRRVAILCSEGRINGSTFLSKMWLIPHDAKKPVDGRTLRKNRGASVNIKPFIKWAGGKGQLLTDIRNCYPKEFGGKINKYVEPMIGGGAVLLDILSNYILDEIYVSDINLDLINTYKSVKLEVEKLIKLLNKYEKEFLAIELDNRKEYYYIKRSRFNEIKLTSKKINVEKAALFIFLNKTCFNGLYRVNRSGAFNVPMGNYKNPCICDESNLRNVSTAIQNVHFECASYLQSEKIIDEHTFVYIDPPYRPLNQTSSFTSYSKFEFGDEQQIELANFAIRVKNKNAKIVLSNSDPKNTDENDEFFDDLYKDFQIDRVKAHRMINSKGNSRGKINELLIYNY